MLNIYTNALKMKNLRVFITSIIKHYTEALHVLSLASRPLTYHKIILVKEVAFSIIIRPDRGVTLRLR